MPSRVPFRLVLAAAALAGLAACSSNSGRLSTRMEPPPGGRDDPWGPYVREASHRFNVPERWVRAVMQQESGGREFIDGKPTTSWKGATGLMQVMPDTYAELAGRYGLGRDPYDPHDNIMAGTAYIREMYDRFGSPGFLAAYNAGPARMDSYLSGGSLPEETQLYLTSVAPRLGGERPGTGPVTAYAEAAPPSPPPADPSRFPSTPAPAPAVIAAAYTPGRSALGTSGAQAAVQTAADPPVPLASPAAFPSGRPAPPPFRAAEPVARRAPIAPAPRGPVLRLVSGAPYADERGTALWTVQVGAYVTPTQARAAADAARQVAHLAGQSVVGAVEHGGTTLFRARVTGLTAESARAACGRLRGDGVDCLVVPPQGA